VEAINFDPNATIDDGSCEFPAVLGCTDPIACNYNLDATDDDGSCVYPEENYDCDENFLGVIHTVFAGNMYYDPSNITINVGDQVRWINNGGMHDVNGEINSITNTPFENPESFNSISVSEVGAVIIVGGNIDHLTRVMTTAIALETSKGELSLAMALGIILLIISLSVNFFVIWLKANGKTKGYV